jgi:hypothetical protein
MNMNGESVRLWKEAVVVNSNIFRHLLGETAENHTQPDRIACNSAEIQTVYLLHVSLECYHYINLVNTFLWSKAACSVSKKTAHSVSKVTGCRPDNEFKLSLFHHV